MDSFDRLELVSRVFGPGTVGGWLLVVLAVFASWIVSDGNSQGDIITNDFIAALTLPGVAAANLVYHLLKYTGDRTQILTTSDPALLPKVAAIEAALSLCDTSGTLMLPLLAIASWKRHGKKCTLVLVVGLLCFGAQTALFVLSPNSSIDSTNFSRPYLVNNPLGMLISIPLLFTLGISVPITAVLLPTESGFKTIFIIATITSLVYLVQVGTFSQGALGLTTRGSQHNWTWNLLFFVPESNLYINDLDQSIALAVGAVTLAFSCSEVFKFWRHKGSDADDSV